MKSVPNFQKKIKNSTAQGMKSFLKKENNLRLLQIRSTGFKLVRTGQLSLSFLRQVMIHQIFSLILRLPAKENKLGQGPSFYFKLISLGQNRCSSGRF